MLASTVRSPSPLSMFRKMLRLNHSKQKSLERRLSLSHSRTFGKSKILQCQALSKLALQGFEVPLAVMFESFVARLIAALAALSISNSAWYF